MAVLDGNEIDDVNEINDDNSEEIDEETPSNDVKNGETVKKSNSISAIDKISVHKICSGQVRQFSESSSVQVSLRTSRLRLTMQFSENRMCS